MMRHSFKMQDVEKWRKNKGMGYAKGGKGIEKQPASKRKPNDPFNMRKVKGDRYQVSRNIIYREKSKSEVNAL